MGTILNYSSFNIPDFTVAATIHNDTIYLAAKNETPAASLKYLYKIVRSEGGFVVEQLSLLPFSGDTTVRLISSMNKLYLIADNSGVFSTWAVNSENGVLNEITTGFEPVFKTPLNIIGTESGIYLAGQYDPDNSENTMIAKFSDDNGWQIIHNNVAAETGKLIMNVVDGQLVMTDILSSDLTTNRIVLDIADDSILIDEVSTPDIYGIEEDSSTYCLNETDYVVKGGLDVSGECVPFTHQWYNSFSAGAAVYSVAGRGERLYVGTDGHITVYNISDPATMTYVTEYSVSGERVYDLEVAGDEMYAATSEGIYRFDISDPDSITLINSYYAGYNYQYRIQLYNDLLYVGDDYGINIRDTVCVNVFVAFC